ncbi:HYC_CC_PP family protein [Flavisolibacter nicotianae]
MKKLVAIIMLLVYFTATTGATVTMHYCMGELRSWKLWPAGGKKEVCSICGMEKKGGCCEDRVMMVRLDKKHQLPATLQKDLPSSPVTVIPGYAKSIFATVNGLTCKKRPATSPPFFDPIPLFVSYCVYRI